MPNNIYTEGYYSFTNLTATGSTTIKTGAGTLHSIVFNTPVGGTVLTTFDNTTATGTHIGAVTLPGTVLAEGPSGAIYDLAFTTGLSIAMTATASDVTITYR